MECEARIGDQTGYLLRQGVQMSCVGIRYADSRTAYALSKTHRDCPAGSWFDTGARCFEQAGTRDDDSSDRARPRDMSLLRL